MTLSAQSPLNSTSSALCFICVRKDSMANPWRAPGNLRKSIEIPGDMGNVRINENSSRITNRIPTDIDIMTRG